MIIEVEREFRLEYPSTLEQAVLYLQDVSKSLANVSFIKNLRFEPPHVYADLTVDVPVLGEQHLDFHSVLELHALGANLIAQPRQGRAWAAVAGQGTVEANQTIEILYVLQITVHLELPSAEKWGGRAFEKMAQATAKTAIERMTKEFGLGVQRGMA
jgi:Protein of unknown function (DUF3809)